MRALLLLASLATSAPAGEINDLVGTVAHGSRPEVEKAINRIQFLGTPKPAVNGLIQVATGQATGNPENALYALAVLHPPEAGPTFLDLLGADEAPIRMASCQGLAKLKPIKSGAKAVAGRLSDPVPAVRRDCAHTLAAWDGAGQGPALARALIAEKDPDAQLAEVDALGHAPGAASEKALEPLLQAPSDQTRYAAARALARIGGASGKKALESWLSALDAQVRADAVELVAGIPGPWATQQLATRLDDPSARVCIRAARALQARKDKRGLETLILRAERASPDDKFAFESALAELKVTQAQRLDVLQKNGMAK